MNLFIALTTLTLIIPVLILVWLAIRNLIKGRPVASGIVLDYQAAAPYLISVMLLFYAVSVALTARQEAKSKQIFFKMIQHEGRYAAESIGQKWPD